MYVAPGMDIVVSIGVVWCHYDKQSEESNGTVVGGASGGAAA